MLVIDNWQLPFLNQGNEEIGLRNYFMIDPPQKYGIKLVIPGSVTDLATEQQIKCLTQTQNSASDDEYAKSGLGPRKNNTIQG